MRSKSLWPTRSGEDMSRFVNFPLPDVGEGLTEADIVDWKVAVGDTVEVNDVLVEIETAKSLVELPSPHAGLITAILAEVGATVDVGAPISTIDIEPSGEPGAAPPAPAQAEPAEEGATEEGATEEGGSGGALVGYGTKVPSATRRPRKAAPAQAAPRRSEAVILAKPPVRKLAKDLGVDLARVPGTGPGGIITRDDVREAEKSSQVENLVVYPGDDRPWLDGGTVSADGRQTRVPVRSVRRRTAEAMVTSAFTAPHVTVFTTIDVTRTMKLVERLREDKEFDGVRVTPLLIAAKALILAIRRHPQISAAWDGDAQEIVYKHYINLGIAAATDRGLVVPNIKNAHRMGLRDLADAIADLTRTARAGKTPVAAMQDGTVTITNVGVFGIDTGTPILNPGESAILAFGAISQRPWVHKGKIKPRWVTQLALSFDHRLVDGELGSRVLADVAAVLERPSRALVWG